MTSIGTLNAVGVAQLVNEFIQALPKMILLKKEIPAIFKEILMFVTDRLSEGLPELVNEITHKILDVCIQEPNIPEVILHFFENIIFSLNKKILSQISWNPALRCTYPAIWALHMLLSANQIPSDEDLISLINTGSPRMLYILSNELQNLDKHSYLNPPCML
jgi:hypothetical protein